MMMADREKIIRSVESCFDYWLDKHRYIHPLELDYVRQMKSDAITILKKQESQIWELQDVIRCKDCRFQVNRGRRFPECDRHFLIAKDDWFCADAKRRDDDG